MLVEYPADLFENPSDGDALHAQVVATHGITVVVGADAWAAWMAHQELGYKLLDRVKVDTAPVAKIESEPRFEGRQMVMLLAPR